jgi:hypothetical protein
MIETNCHVEVYLVSIAQQNVNLKLCLVSISKWSLDLVIRMIWYQNEIVAPAFGISFDNKKDFPMNEAFYTQLKYKN